MIISFVRVDKLQQLTDEVEGWLTQPEGRLLYHLARNCRRGHAIVEIGSYQGKSTIWLAHGAKDGNRPKLYVIDPHNGIPPTLDRFLANIHKASVDDIVVPIVKKSEDAAQDVAEPIDLVFVDGNHSFEYVKKDFDLWFPKITMGGTMAFHDVIWSFGPRVVVTRKVLLSNHFGKAVIVGALVAAPKTNWTPFTNRLENVLLARRVWVNALSYPGSYLTPGRVRLTEFPLARALGWVLTPGSALRRRPRGKRGTTAEE